MRRTLSPDYPRNIFPRLVALLAIMGMSSLYFIRSRDVSSNFLLPGITTADQPQDDLPGLPTTSELGRMIDALPTYIAEQADRADLNDLPGLSQDILDDARNEGLFLWSVEPAEEFASSTSSGSFVLAPDGDTAEKIIQAQASLDILSDLTETRKRVDIEATAPDGTPVSIKSFTVDPEVVARIVKKAIEVDRQTVVVYKGTERPLNPETAKLLAQEAGEALAETVKLLMSYSLVPNFAYNEGSVTYGISLPGGDYDLVINFSTIEDLEAAYKLLTSFNVQSELRAKMVNFQAGRWDILVYTEDIKLVGKLSKEKWSPGTAFRIQIER